MMKMARPAWWLRACYPTLTWLLPNEQRAVYLTFDDGPTPGITDWVLDQLDQYQAEATFFLIGKNIEENPQLFQRLKDSGHALGNHTYNHLNGWKSTKSAYLENVRKCDMQLSTSLFRPPYGKITRGQAREILQSHRIIMWDIITYDFDKNTSTTQCFEHIERNVRSGSVIVFHDSIKAWPNLKEVLPKTLEFLAGEGFVMKSISDQ